MWQKLVTYYCSTVITCHNIIALLNPLPCKRMESCRNTGFLKIPQTLNDIKAAKRCYYNFILCRIIYFVAETSQHVGIFRNSKDNKIFLIISTDVWWKKKLERSNTAKKPRFTKLRPYWCRWPTNMSLLWWLMTSESTTRNLYSLWPPKERGHLHEM